MSLHSYMILGFTYNCYNQKNTRTYLTQVKKTKINLIKDRTRINQPHQQDKKVAPTVTSPTTSPITFGLRLEHHQPMCHLLLADSYMFGICWPCLATRLLEGKHKKTQSAPKQGSPLYYLPAPVILEADVPTFKTHSQRLIASSYEKALHSRDSASKRFNLFNELRMKPKYYIVPPSFFKIILSINWMNVVKPLCQMITHLSSLPLLKYEISLWMKMYIFFI